MKSKILALVLLLCGFTPSLAAQYPTLARGFEADRLYQFNDFDSVNNFNGNLVVTVPIGQTFKGNGNLSYRISAVYNSRNWDFERRIYQGADPGYSSVYLQEFNKAIPSKRSNAGMGWLVHMGRIIAPEDPINEYPVDGAAARWAYESPDGGDHLFWPSIHAGEGPVASFQYTRDGSFLRLKTLDTSNVDLHFPDGAVHKFNKGGNRYWLTKISDVYGNSLNVTYVDASGVAVSSTLRESAAAWKLEERDVNSNLVRTHWIRFAARSPLNAPSNSPLRNQSQDPPHFQANDLITRGADGLADEAFKKQIEQNQKHYIELEALRENDPEAFDGLVLRLYTDSTSSPREGE